MNTRQIAAHILHSVIGQGQSLTHALDNALPALSNATDRAFVQALCYGTLRYFHRLDYILQQLLNKPVRDIEVKALLLIGLYQLCFMRIKPHAAVSETVNAVGKKKHHSKGLINAVLRNYLRNAENFEATADRTPVAASAHPDWLIQKIEANWPQQSRAILQANNQQAPMILRINGRFCSRANYLQQLAQQGILATPSPLCPSAIILQQAVAVEKLPGFSQGLVSIQDTAAQFAAGLLELKAGQRVLDVCAAPGGKTAHILETQPEIAHLTAVDINEQRLQRVRENLQRLRLYAETRMGDALEPACWWDGRPFDRILLDAPCSAIGVIRRHPDIKLLRRDQDIRSLQKRQQCILNQIWPLLAPQGILLYATCSILKQENEQQIQTFLSTHNEAYEIPITADWGLATAHGRQILPGDQDMDGFYYAKIGKL